ncbi:NADP-specific glutamate dehydrogenase [Marinobacter fonticola]|uniref:NADP-specific glutamate dehydrogenase n=1 Tax=Marinobacter fonticola TaxID=2603215 RepID=UPI0011E69212|nr:NADP-specific glutamate dehydrogenase [Marinobacter fonticola]
MDKSLKKVLESMRERDPHQPEFHQAVEEVLTSLSSYIESHPDCHSQGLLERLLEPERVIQFRVAWVDDDGNVQVNRGFRVQMNSAIGPYKGGLRFHPSVNLGILKFLAFEQVFKNALTTLPLGGAKGGSDFDPKGKSDAEVMRFCQAFMAEMYRHIGENVDVPAGDIGVGPREIGYLYGMYRKLSNQVTGAFTGKGVAYGGSYIRPEATGYGLVYFVEEMLKAREKTLNNLRVAVSGSGNVAQHTIYKAMELEAKVVTVSDSDGTVHNPDGFTCDQWDFLVALKNERRGRVSELAEKFDLEYAKGSKPWRFACDVALPCATQNELDEEDAGALIDNGCLCVSEGANMPSTAGAVEQFRRADVLFAPGKAANAGGVAVSGLEMTQNSTRQHWSVGEVDAKLHEIMVSIHHACQRYGESQDDPNGRATDYVKGANIAAFIKLADAMQAQGVL